MLQFVNRAVAVKWFPYTNRYCWNLSLQKHFMAYRLSNFDLLHETFSCWKSCRIRKFPLSVIAIAVLNCLKVFLNILFKLQSRSSMNRSVSLMRISTSLGSVGCMESSFTTISAIQSVWFLLHTVKAWWKNGFLSLSTINVKFLLLTGRPTLLVFSNVVNCVPIVDKLDSKLGNTQNKSSLVVFASDVRLNY